MKINELMCIIYDYNNNKIEVDENNELILDWDNFLYYFSENFHYMIENHYNILNKIARDKHFKDYFTFDNIQIYPLFNNFSQYNLEAILNYKELLPHLFDEKNKINIVNKYVHMLYEKIKYLNLIFDTNIFYDMQNNVNNYHRAISNIISFGSLECVDFFSPIIKLVHKNNMVTIFNQSIPNITQKKYDELCNIPYFKNTIHSFNINNFELDKNKEIYYSYLKDHINYNKEDVIVNIDENLLLHDLNNIQDYKIIENIKIILSLFEQSVLEQNINKAKIYQMKKL